MQRRPRYREGQIIGVSDLRAEQQYLLAGARRHNIVLHDWGIVEGLEVEVDADGIRVDRGFAVDGLGRELIVRRRLFVPFSRSPGQEIQRYGDWRGGAAPGEKQGGIAVWLQYNVAGTDASCGADRHIRWTEDPYLSFTPWVPSNPRQTPDQIDVEVPPWLTTIDANRGDPPWPVLLAWLKKTSTGYAVDDRQVIPYARLIAASVQACSTISTPEDPDAPAPAPVAPVTTSRVDLARQLGGASVFAVTAPTAQGALRSRLRINSEGTATFDADVKLGDSITEQYADLLIAATEFTPDDVVDAPGLVCYLRNGRLPVAKLLARALTADPSRYAYVHTKSLAQFLTRLAARAPRQQRVALAWLLNELSALMVYDPAEMGPIALRQDTWTAIANSPHDIRAPGERALTERARVLLLADLLSPFVQIPPGRRAGAQGLTFRPITPVPSQPQPWSIYRADVEKNGKTTKQLRIELATPPGDAAAETSRLRVGNHAGGAFQPLLTVDSGGKVTVHHDLDVEGRLVEQPIPADPSDPDFVEELLESWRDGTLGGVSTASTLKLTFVNLVAARSGTDWPYDVKLKNEGTAAVDNVTVNEGLGMGQQIIMPRQIATIPSLAANTEVTIHVTHSTLNQTSGSISVAVSAVAAGSALGFMFAVEITTVPITT